MIERSPCVRNKKTLTYIDSGTKIFGQHALGVFAGRSTLVMAAATDN
jgi:hypothetical protein